MINRHLTALIALAIVSSLALSACSQQQKPVAVSVNKPHIEIPTSFASEEARRDFGMKAVSEGFYAEAAQVLVESLKAKPDAQALSRLGTAQYNLGKYSEAIEAWREAGRLNATLLGEMNNNIGNALRDQGKLEEAREAYHTALRSEPGLVRASTNLATILRSEGKKKEAIQVLEDAVKHNEDAAGLKDLLSAYKNELAQS